MRNTLYVENLPAHGGAAEVERLLRPFGPVRCTAAATDPDMLRRCPGYALVALQTPALVRAALKALDGRACGGGTLRVRRAVPADVARVHWACRWEYPGGNRVRRSQGIRVARKAVVRAPARAKAKRGANA
jgi:RNA recognition motif-containing protein